MEVKMSQSILWGVGWSDVWKFDEECLGVEMRSDEKIEYEFVEVCCSSSFKILVEDKILP